MDIIVQSAKVITKDFSNAAGKIAKPYMQQLTAQILGAGVPAKYLQYAFRIIFEEQRRWRIQPNDKYLIAALNRIVIGELLVPNYNRSQKPDQDYIANINEALKQTAKWARGRPARILQVTYDKLTLKAAIKANKEIPLFPLLEWLENFYETITNSSSFYSGGGRTAEILVTLLK